MVRSSLTDKFTRKEWEDFEREVKKQYKEETGNTLKCSVAEYVTIGVINRKGLPDISDITSLMKRGLFNKTDEHINTRINTWLEDEENKEKGYTGIFCEICKDLTLDIPIHPVVNGKIKNMWDTINSRLEKQGNNIMKQLIELTKNIQKVSDEVKNVPEEKVDNITDFKEVNNEKPEELGVEDKNTQE